MQDRGDDGAMRGEPLQVLLVRHGETEWNRERRLQGQLDVPLSAVGRCQAARVAQQLALELQGLQPLLLSSDLARAHQTAAPIAQALGVPVRLDAAWRERHFGRFQGMPYAQIGVSDPATLLRWAARDPQDDLDGGESLEFFRERAWNALQAAVQAAAATHTRHLVVVTHGGALEMLRRTILKLSLQEARDFEVPNAALFQLELGRDWELTRWADVAHLAGPDAELGEPLDDTDNAPVAAPGLAR